MLFDIPACSFSKQILRITAAFWLFPFLAAAVQPVITSVNPATIAGTAPFTLTVTGEGFTSATQVRLSGLLLTVTDSSPNQIVATGQLDSQTTGLCALTAVNGTDASNPLAVTATAYSTPPVLSEAEALRFLQHSTFGPTRAAVDHLRAIGYAAWFSEQFDPSQFSTYPDSLITQPKEWAQYSFFQNAVTSSDQLRQRMAFALHKIFVVSSGDVSTAEGFLSYLRVLDNDAFGNFLDLMRDITLNPAMGEYLSMVNNAKVSPDGSGSPNENYARELLQLFTIGLIQLNPDGSPKLDAAGSTIPTYGQAEVTTLARAFTGWTYSPRPGQYPGSIVPYYSAPMVVFEPNHDTNPKTLFNGVTLPAGQTAEQDLEGALKNIFQHPNTGPFLARGLIQQFVTSNPSPDYVSRVAAVFADNGSGVRGDLSAVLRAILLDAEATDPQQSSGGHLREPVLFLTAALRLFNAQITEYPFLAYQSSDLGQNVLFPPSVFSYFSPGYRYPGTPVAAPEFQILTAQSAMNRMNVIARLINAGYGDVCKIDLTRFLDAAADTTLLLDMVNHEFFGGRMDPNVRIAMFDAVQAQQDRTSKALTAIYLAGSSPFFQVIF